MSGTSSATPPLPAAFAERTARTLGPDESEALWRALAEPAAVAVRLNPRKPSRAFADAAPVPWCLATGRYLTERPLFALDPLWHAGAYYVQEPSSQLLDWALRTALPDIAEPDRPWRVLDLCAAPGGKATLLAGLLGDASLLVANEAIRSRVPRLRENLTRWGWPNVVVTGVDPERFAPAAGWFDVVVVDAPCSGEGMFRKDAKAAAEWSEANAALCAARQQRILHVARELVAPGGLLVYSTCTFNPAENDGAVEAALLGAGSGYAPVPLTPPDAWGVSVTRAGLQCWPHRMRGEGFYLSLLRRRAGGSGGSGGSGAFRRESPPSPFSASLAPTTEHTARALLSEPGRFDLWMEGADVRALPWAGGVHHDAQQLISSLGRGAAASAGVMLGTLKGREFVPAHDVALSARSRPDLPAWTMDREMALAYVRKEPLPEPPAALECGWALAAYEGRAIGWLKLLGDGRVNNYLPTEARLRLAGTGAEAE